MKTLENWDPNWTDSEKLVFRDFGHVAFLAQMLESSLITILLAAEFSGNITIVKPKRKIDLESELFLSEKTFGQLVCELKKGGIDDETLAILIGALKARNYLMHHFYVWNSQNYLNETGRLKMREELQDLRFKIGRAQTLFADIREQIVEKIYGLSKQQLEEHYRDFLSDLGTDTPPPISIRYEIIYPQNSR